MASLEWFDDVITSYPEPQAKGTDFESASEVSDTPAPPPDAVVDLDELERRVFGSLMEVEALQKTLAEVEGCVSSVAPVAPALPPTVRKFAPPKRRRGLQKWLAWRR